MNNRKQNEKWFKVMMCWQKWGGGGGEKWEARN